MNKPGTSIKVECCITCKHFKEFGCLRNMNQCLDSSFSLWEPIEEINLCISQFDQVLKERLRKIEEILGKKAKEYAKNDDRYHNFNVAARINNTSSEKALKGMMLKHIVSVFDLIEDPKSATFELIDEKIGDQINYLILLEGMMKSRWGIFKNIETIDYELEDKGNSFFCQLCKKYGLPSIYVFISKTKEKITRYGLCTSCANKMRVDNKYNVVNNEIRM